METETFETIKGLEPGAPACTNHAIDPQAAKILKQQENREYQTFVSDLTDFLNGKIKSDQQFVNWMTASTTMKLWIKNDQLCDLTKRLGQKYIELEKAFITCGHTSTFKGSDNMKFLKNLYCNMSLAYLN
jgi:hypothetical protein